MESDGRSSGSPQFGVLLRQYRLAAGLSQEALAERARLSSDGISALERGHRRTPQRETLALLAGALALSGEQRRDFEAAATRSGRSNGDESATLPLTLSSFVGRAEELDEIAALVREHRLVTLTGSGGIGKTQMALRVGAAVSETAEGSVRFVALAPVGASLVAAAIASAAGVREAPNRPLLESLIAFLKSKTLLLILDNCEHVITETAIVASALLAGTPGIRILATSREPLKAPGERAYRLPSLSVPDADASYRLTAARAREFGAIALFTDRAGAVDHRFALTDENAPLVAELCRRLDGIPLAIELAAARVNLLPLKALTERLDERFRILTSGDRIALPRQQTMHATIDWSYNLLSEVEQRLFERLSIFVGGCTIEAAETVAADEQLDAASIFELLSSLADKSLVVVDLDGNQPRYRLLESTHAFALEKLSQKGAQSAIARRHAQWAAHVADEAVAAVSATSIDLWARAFEPELENARTAIEWALSVGEISLAARIASEFTGIWRLNHSQAEPRRWLERITSTLDGEVAPSLQARVWRALSTVTFGVHRVEAARRALELDERGAERRSTVTSLYQLGQGLLEAGRFKEAEAASTRALRICQESGLTRSRRYAAALDMCARMAAIRDSVEEARQYYTEALSMMTALGDEHEAILIRINMGELEYRAGNFRRALEFADAAVTAARRLRSRHREITALANSAACCLALGNLEGARVNAAEALALARWAPPMEVAIAVQHLATVAASSEQQALAGRLCGYVDSWYRNEGCERELTERRSYEILIAALRKQFTKDELAVLALQGAALSEEQAVVEALRV
jgi:predicted ATPase/DNA-binding XRE family transcriptional regulator